jgi:5-formyltetrahydrofolate cyclo-ligase
MPKRSLRRTMLAHRKSLSEAEFRSASYLIQEFFLETEEYRRAKRIVLYASIHNEVATERVVAAALQSGKTVAFPVVVHHGLAFHEVDTLSSLKKGAFGIMEPCTSGRCVAMEESDIFVLPGVVFDLKGHRIGYGKGYYDKALHRFEGQGKFVGFCYDFQLVDEIAKEPHDVRMDMIITEKRLIRTIVL